nr:hypothetical protein [Tanacetum cinerariifolium]
MVLSQRLGCSVAFTLIPRTKVGCRPINVFAGPALFPWHTGKSVSRDVIPKSFEFSSEHYATLVAYPAPFHKACCSTPTAPGHSSGELEASVEKFFGEGGNGEQAKHDDSASGGHGVGNIVTDSRVTPSWREIVSLTPSHPAKKLSDDYEALGGPTVGGKSQSSIHRLLAGECRDSSDHSGVNIAKAEVDYVIRTSMPIITSATTTTPTADPAAIAKEKLVGSSVFGDDSPFAGESHPIPGGFSDLSGSGFLIGGIQTVIDPDFNIQNVYVRMRAEYHIKEKRMLKAIVEENDQVLKARDEEIKNLKAHLLLKETKATEAIRLRAETSQFEAVEKSLQDKVTALNERKTILKKECNALDVKVTDLQAVVVSKDRELTNSVAQLTSIKSYNDNLTDQSIFESEYHRVANAAAETCWLQNLL